MSPLPGSRHDKHREHEQEVVKDFLINYFVEMLACLKMQAANNCLFLDNHPSTFFSLFKKLNN